MINSICHKKLFYYPTISSIHNLTILLPMEELTVFGLNRIIQSYAKQIQKIDDFRQVHLECIAELLNNHDIYESNMEKRLANRKFVCFLLWSSIDFCTEAMNKKRWIFSLDLMATELSEASGKAEQQILLAYSILKFVGQYTDDRSIYNRCYQILDGVTTTGLPISPADMKHLFAFNSNFLHMRQQVPPKSRGFNRLLHFFTSGIGSYSAENSREYSQLRYDYARGRFISNCNEANCLYYLDTLYYTLGDTHIRVKQMYECLCVFVDTDVSKYVLAMLEAIAIFAAGRHISILEKFIIVNQFDLETILKDTVNKRLLMLVPRRENHLNQEELIYIIDEAITVPDSSFDSSEYYSMFRIALFERLYRDYYLRPGDSYSEYAKKIAAENEVEWIPRAIRLSKYF